MTSPRPDVVVVGAGIAGGALATVLARAGRDVVVLERQVEYRDRVRGETMFPWGVAELLQLGLQDELLATGGGYATAMLIADEATASGGFEPFALPLDGMVEGVPGQLNVGHPQACEALATSAAAAGARVERGVGAVTVTPGPSPRVEFARDGTVEELFPRLVAGADGRTSEVRRACGLTLQETTPRLMLAGYLVGGVDGWPPATNAMTTEGDCFVLAFPRPNDLLRIYLAYSVAQKNRFSGPTKVDEFMRVLGGLTSMSCFAALADASPAGPLGAYPMTDSWLDEPFVPGVVLAGDAAGWSDPTIGQGLSVAMRDVRVLSEILLSDAADDLRAYAEERTERMRRLRFALQVTVAARADFSDRGRARRVALGDALSADPRLLQALLITVIGPHAVPDDVVTDDVLETLLAVGG